jgi:hypothetical protein
MLNVGRTTVQAARQVIDGGIPELVRAVEAGRLAVSKAAGIAKEKRAEQAGLLDEALKDRSRPARSSRGTAAARAELPAAGGVGDAVDSPPAAGAGHEGGPIVPDTEAAIRGEPGEVAPPSTESGGPDGECSTRLAPALEALIRSCRTIDDVLGPVIRQLDAGIAAPDRAELRTLVSRASAGLYKITENLRRAEEAARDATDQEAWPGTP